ncbi:Flagellar protein FliS [Marinomonas aquimarina]|uniref:Flagellar secretion chaperone FliS n=1 Tax=Marinomonas aquimarina TaxID=295068 RepID=A0A1A8T0U0_9GAMM|nr:flagellar export chaperone FliS [Marinomonas aquimarina]SBS25519.1 Flagellar protein FliS [Marinomonas aquimarina]
MYAKKGIQAYKRDSISADLTEATPHRVIQLLMQGVLEKTAQGKGYIERRDIEGKAEALSRASAIINALRGALDREVNPELCDNLDSLYEYMIGLIAEASVTMNVEKLDEVIKLMLTIKSAWDQISEEDKQLSEQMRQERQAAVSE